MDIIRLNIYICREIFLNKIYIDFSFYALEVFREDIFITLSSGCVLVTRFNVFITLFSQLLRLISWMMLGKLC